MAKLSYSFPKFFGTIVKRAGIETAVAKAFRDLVREIEKLHIEIAKAVNANTQEDWIDVSFENGWVNFNGSHNSAQYRLRGDKQVELRGLVKSGTIGAVPIFTLPANYRPVVRYVMIVISNNLIGRVNIEADGHVECTVGNNAWVSLDGIVFSTE